MLPAHLHDQGLEVEGDAAAIIAANHPAFICTFSHLLLYAIETGRLGGGEGIAPTVDRGKQGLGDMPAINQIML